MPEYAENAAFFFEAIRIEIKIVVRHGTYPDCYGGHMRLSARDFNQNAAFFNRSCFLWSLRLRRCVARRAVCGIGTRCFCFQLFEESGIGR